MELLAFAKVHAAEEIDARDDAFGIFVGNAELTAALSADGDIEGFIALFAEIGDRHILADFDAGLELDAHVFDASISASTTFFSRRKEGMPKVSMPPSFCSFSNTVTL
jgi:hypothetical protein